jgi:hypothetical protein
LYGFVFSRAMIPPAIVSFAETTPSRANSTVLRYTMPPALDQVRKEATSPSLTVASLGAANDEVAVRSSLRRFPLVTAHATGAFAVIERRSSGFVSIFSVADCAPLTCGSVNDTNARA